MSYTPRAWKSSPEWLAAASASSSPSSGSPARSIAAACSGLFADRGKTGVLALPVVNANVPSAASAATAPRCRDSTKPDRTTSASTGFTATSAGDSCSRVTAPLWSVSPVRLAFHASSRAAGDPGQRHRRRSGHRRDRRGRRTGAARAGRRHPRRQLRHCGQTRQEALGPAHSRRREVREDLGAPLLVVSQFTLYGDTRKGRRPTWQAAAPGPVAEPLVDAVVGELGTSARTSRRGSSAPTCRSRSSTTARSRSSWSCDAKKRARSG